MFVSNPTDVGLLVRERRKDLGLSQQELADRSGVSRAWLVSVEQGHPRAELGKVLALLSELDLDLNVTTAAKVGSIDLDSVLDGVTRKRT